VVKKGVKGYIKLTKRKVRYIMTTPKDRHNKRMTLDVWLVFMAYLIKTKNIRGFQIILYHGDDVFIAWYPFSKWTFEKEVYIYLDDGMVQTVWYIFNLQIGVWHTEKSEEVHYSE